LEVSTGTRDRVLLVKVSGELDMHTVAKFKDRIISKMDSNNLNDLVLNFSGVTFIDSSGLGAILGRYRSLLKKNGRIILVGLNPSVKKVFKLAGMLKIMKECKNEDEALRELNEGGL